MSSSENGGLPANLWPLGGEPGYISPPPSGGGASVRHVAVLGSTGSIGRNALAVAEASGCIRVHALAAGDNVDLLAEQAIRWQPEWLAVRNEELSANLRRLLPRSLTPKIVWGAEGYAMLASLPAADCVLCAQAGISGLVGTLTAALAGKIIALANKESLVAAGDLLRRICQRTGASILPVDSEHFALFECLLGRQLGNVSRLILTASGGPFLHKSLEEMARATPEDALRHPNWRMGAKISVDSATMMNKGLELIEAVALFGVQPERIQIIVQPQSIIHSLVEFADNGILAQLATPDMKLPISGCLLWPHFLASAIEPLDLATLGHLDFLNPDERKFPVLKLARQAVMYQPGQDWAQAGLNPARIALTGANEAAVELFLKGKIPLTDIPVLVEAAIGHVSRENAFGAAPVWPRLDDAARQGVAMAKIIAGLVARVRTFTEAAASPAEVVD